MMTAAGVWTYTLDNNNATVQALNAGAPLIDSFMALTVDGTAQLVTITITGANDAADDHRRRLGRGDRGRRRHHQHSRPRPAISM